MSARKSEGLRVKMYDPNEFRREEKKEPLTSLHDVFLREVTLPASLPRGERGEADVKDVAFAELQLRDLAAVSDVAGGYLVPKGTPVTVIDFLGAVSVCTRLGSPTIPVDVLAPLPKITDPGTAGVLYEGGAAVEPVTATFGSVNPSMRCAAAFANVSRLLNKVSGIVGVQAVELILLGNVARQLDAMAINGTGVGGDFLGILNVPGVQSISGATFSKATEAALLRKLDDANADTEKAAFAVSPDVAETLRTREAPAGSGRYILEGGQIGGRPCLVSNAVPTGYLIVGVWSEILFLVRSVEATSNPYTGAKAGAVEAGIYWHGDAIIRHPSAFAVATGVS